MGGGGSGQTTQTTTVQLSPEQRKILGFAMPGLEKFATENPTAQGVIPPFSGVAGFDPAQVAGQEQVLGAAPGQASVTGTAAGGTNFLSGGNVLMPESNPALARTIEASTRPITEQLLFNAMPVIRNKALAAGQFGGSRQGIAEGLAIKGAEQATGDTAAKVATQGYTSGLDAMTKAIGLSPNVAQSLALPGVTTSGVGDVRQQMAQALLGEQTGRFTESALWPLLMGKEYAGITGSIPGGSTQTVADAPKSNSLMQALGLGISGASALLPFLFMSDRRVKTAIRKLSGTFRGLPLYAYRYIGDTLPRVGVMADEVPAYARLRVNGIDFVDYGAL